MDKSLPAGLERPESCTPGFPVLLVSKLKTPLSYFCYSERDLSKKSAEGFRLFTLKLSHPISLALS